ncbi:Allantoicase repeat-containing protein [Gordonia westfalica]|uniref:Allantoicase repeat-containing protein n=1 Tax=Gordonia westfalica TaxID=158898 RepID=A0A1H2LJR3_9ACTN|nr:Allantoicase repeat-containing protein [Gordonia westfalica]
MTPLPPPNPAGTRPHFTSMPDLALRDLGGAVVWTNDELFAESQNLIKTTPAEYQPATFGHRGQVYDGWETRRRPAPLPEARGAQATSLEGPVRHRRPPNHRSTSTRPADFDRRLPVELRFGSRGSGHTPQGANLFDPHDAQFTGRGH